MFHRPPKALDKNVIPPGTTAIHAHSDRVLQQQPGERRACELRTLIGIQNSGILPSIRVLRSPFTIRIIRTCGKRATVIGWNRFGDKIYFVLERPNASPFQIPVWMTEPSAAGMTVRESPRESILRRYAAFGACWMRLCRLWKLDL